MQILNGELLKLIHPLHHTVILSLQTLTSLTYRLYRPTESRKLTFKLLDNLLKLGLVVVDCILYCDQIFEVHFLKENRILF